MIDTPPQAKRCTSFEDFRSFMASPANRDADIAAFEAGLSATARRTGGDRQSPGLGSRRKA